MVVAATGSRPSPASNDSFSVLDPALTTRTASATRPDPVLHLGHVVADLPHVVPVAVALVDHPLVHDGGLAPEVRYAVDHVHDEVVAVEVVHHDHVEGRGRGAFLDVATHVDVRVVGAAVGEPVDQP